MHLKFIYIGVPAVQMQLAKVEVGRDCKEEGVNAEICKGLERIVYRSRGGGQLCN